MREYCPTEGQMRFMDERAKLSHAQVAGRAETQVLIIISVMTLCDVGHSRIGSGMDPIFSDPGRMSGRMASWSN
jgi:hypothetical protein